ncbi:MAG: ABC transporter permease [Candidatus Methanomethylophilaceae archaeon]|nr:ABC transporter permease [Candidatus Methanomethylophilaceae archaeon]
MTNRILVDLSATIKDFYRSPSAMFWTFAFPLLLILIFGAIFSGGGDGTYTMYVQNLDQNDATGISQSFLDTVNSTGAVNMVMIDPSTNLDDFIRDNSPSSVLIIPSGFGMDVNLSGDGLLIFRMDQSSQSAQVVLAVINGVAQHMNLALANASESIGVQTTNIINTNMNYMDFFIPGIIGLTVMNNSVNYITMVMCDYRSRGIFRKLKTTPISRVEWLTSQIIWQLVLNFASVLLITLVGVTVFGMNISLDFSFWLLIIVGTALFTALGMILGGLIKNQDTAGSVVMAITFPMMFLSGSFFALDMMPDYLQSIATVLPLTYLNEGLRDAMVYGNLTNAYYNLLVLVGVTAVFVAVASLTTKWKED